MTSEKKRKIGAGMKPRVINEMTTEKQPETENAESVVDGQWDEVPDAPLEGELGDAGDGRLDAKNGENAPESQLEVKVALEAKEEPEKALNATVEDGATVTLNGIEYRVGIDYGANELEEMLKASLPEVLPPAEPEPGTYGAIKRTPADVEKSKAALQEAFSIDLKIAGLSADRRINAPKTTSIAELQADVEGGADVSIDPAGNVFILNNKLGQQPDGTYGLVVSIPEGYIEGIKQEAGNSDQTAEQWMSTRISEYLEGWYFGK